MMTTKRYFRIFLAAIIAIGSLAACCNDDEEYVNPTPDDGGGDDTTEKIVTVNVNFDWENASNANPSGMCVYFYSQGALANTSFRRFDFSSTNGGTVKIPSGKYNVVCYNNDTEAVRFYGTDNFYSHTAYTREGSVYEPIYGNTADGDDAPTIDNQRVTIEPDMMWGCAVKDIDIAAADADSITLKPHQLVHEYSFEIRNAQTLGNVAGLSVAISGIASEFTFANETCGKECVVIPTSATFDGSTITGTFRAFGYPKTVTTVEGKDTVITSPNYLMIYAVKADGSTVVYGSDGSINITDQLQQGSNDTGDTTHETIVIDGIGEAHHLDGLLPNVDDWNEENIEIKI